MDQRSGFSLTVDLQNAGKRLDVFISERIRELSRSTISSLIKSNHIRVGRQTKKPGYLIKAGDHVTGVIPSAQPCTYLPEPIDLPIIFEDDHIIVINKPPGLVVHPAPGHNTGTLVHALLHHCPDLPGIGGEMRPGIVHRLDKDTSGALVAAKTEAALHHLAAQFKQRTVEKEYAALVIGEPALDSGRINLPIGRHPTDRKKMSIHSRKGRQAETRWEVLKRLGGFSLLRLDIKTGRTHQIRVHLTAIGHPIVGDPVYGKRRMMRGLAHGMAGLLKPIQRQMLHAARLSFIHPQTTSAMSFEAEMPHDMADIASSLRRRVLSEP